MSQPPGRNRLTKAPRASFRAWLTARKDAHAMRVWLRLMGDDRGQDLIEYALLGALVSVSSILALTVLGVAVGNFFQTSITTELAK